MQFFQILLTWISQTTKLDGIIVGSSECVFTMTNSCAILEFFSFLCNIFIGLCMEVCMLNSMHTMLLLSGLVGSVSSSPLYHLQSTYLGICVLIKCLLYQLAKLHLKVYHFVKGSWFLGWLLKSKLEPSLI